MGIVSATGWSARFEIRLGGKATYETREVVVWSEGEDGVCGMVVADRGHLRSAESYANFIEYTQSVESPQAFLPATPGWWAVTAQKDGTAWWERIVVWTIALDGWALRAIGQPDTDGCSEPMRANETTRFIYDPTRQAIGDGPIPWAEEEASDAD